MKRFYVTTIVFMLSAIHAYGADFLPNLEDGIWERTVISTNQSQGTQVKQDNQIYLWNGKLYEVSPNRFILDQAVYEGSSWYSAKGKLSKNNLLLKISSPSGYCGEREITKFSEQYFVVLFKHGDCEGNVYAREVYTFRKIN